MVSSDVAARCICPCICISHNSFCIFFHKTMYSKTIIAFAFCERCTSITANKQMKTQIVLCNDPVLKHRHAKRAGVIFL